MAHEELVDATVFTKDGSSVGKVVDDSADTKVEINAPDGRRFWVERYDLQFENGKLTLADDYTEYSSTDAEGFQDESDLDKASADSFPASDPPSFTMGDEGKGR
ncbi:hypothetical protein R5M92_06310 [Halomonas sp. Bachu 37]|uniref:hypothetical protein n=1 Tax=Halomonas kashgarensis TaxID=3084920 RepID=UPI00321633AF